MPADDAARRPAPPPCPICGKPREAAFRPFCSKRCADVDLGRWFTGRYAIPGESSPDGAEPEEDGSESGG